MTYHARHRRNVQLIDLSCLAGYIRPSGDGATLAKSLGKIKVVAVSVPCALRILAMARLWVV
jgi:hypothetical protein